MKENFYKIGDLCNIRTGKLDANASSENGKYPFFTCAETPLRIDTFSYDVECVLIAGNGDLNVKYYKGKFDAYQRTYILTLKPEISDVDMLYIYKYFLNYIKYLRQQSIGGIIKYIRLGNLTEAKIQIPSITKQKIIVSELDLLSGVIEKQKAQLEELDKFAQSIFYDMFGDPVTNEKGWEVKKLCDIVSFKNGINYHAGDKGDTIKLIGVGDFKNNNEIRCFEDVKTIHIEDIIDESYLLRDGDILIVRSNGSKDLVGRNMIVYTSGEEITYSGFCIRCRVNNKAIIPLFLNRILSDRNTMKILRQEGQGCNISNINQKILSSLSIVLPPLSLQQEFAAKVEAIEAMKAKVRLSLKEAETLFNERMDYYFN